MSQRRRPASEGTAAVLPLQESPTLPAPSAGNVRAGAAESCAQECAAAAELRGLHDWARRWGLPVPGPSLGVPPSPSAAVDLMSALWAGQKVHLTSIPVQMPEFLDTDLDAAQRQAVARALATPDLCLIQGLPGSGKSRVLAEILTQLVARGQRALLLAPTAAALDRVLELLPRDVARQALRWCGPEEHPDQLPPAAQAQTLLAWRRRLEEQLLPELRQAGITAQRRREQRRTEATLWSQLFDLVGEYERLEHRSRLLQEQQAALPALVARQVQLFLSEEASPHSPDVLPEWQARLRQDQHCYRVQEQQLQTRQQQLRDLVQQHQKQLQDLHTRRQTLTPLAEAWQQRRWWSWHWWRALCSRTWRDRLSILEKDAENLRGVLSSLQAELHALEEAQAQLAACFAQKCQQQQQAEVARRQAALQDEENALRQQLDLLRTKAEDCWSQLLAEQPFPTAWRLDLVQAAYQAWQERCRQEQIEDELSVQALAHVESLLTQEADDWLVQAHLLFAPISLLYATSRADLAGTWDMVLVEEADCLSQADLLAAAHWGRRCLLVGSTHSESLGLIPQTDGAERSGGTPFVRLWEALHADPRRLPVAWIREGDRLCCRLHPVPAEARHYLEREPVTDFPDIELRILALPGTPPQLAEILFPPTLSLSQAKQYLYRELEKVSIQAQGRNAFWQEHPEGWRFWLGPEPRKGIQAVDLAEGVREWLGDWPEVEEEATASGQPVGLSWALDFARAQGWERARCEEWVQQHLHLCDWKRTFYLDRLHRPSGALAAVLAELLGQPGMPPSEGRAGCLPAVEFLPIPTQMPQQRCSNPPTAGVGLEVDLRIPREAARLPAALRARLPAKGLVNYPEAQAVVRYVKRLLQESCLSAQPAPRTIAVLAFQPAQVTLLQALLADCGLPEHRDVEVVATLPEAWRQRECLVAVVSLTRSSRHSVPFSTSAEQWLLALTRPRLRLCLVGDPGMLCRRASERGAAPLSPAALLEIRIVQGLLRYLRGQGRYPQAFRLLQGPEAS